MNYNLLLALLISVTTCAMDEVTLAQQALNQPTSELFVKLPAELQENVAIRIYKSHPMVDYIKRSADLCTSTLEGHTCPVTSASFNPDGTTLLTTSEDRTKIWEVRTGNCLHILQGHTDYVNSASFSPDGTTIVTASYDRTAKIWDVRTGNCLHTLEGHNSNVMSASFSPDGTTLLTTSDDRTAKIWEVQTGNYLHTLQGHTNYVNSASFSPDSTTLVTTSDDETAKIWDVTTLERFFTKESTLPQAVLLNAIYEIVIIRALVKKWGQRAFNQKASAYNQITSWSDKAALSLLGEDNSTHEAMLFDFDKYPHLREHYRRLPVMIKNILEPFINNSEESHEL